MRRKKGFTLMELVVVVAIFGVLIAVVTPAWAGYVRRSKTKAQNQKAKAIFNAAQTAVIDLDFSERKYKAALNGASDDYKKILNNHIYTPGSEWYYYWEGNRGYLCDAKGDELKASDMSYSTERTNTLNEWNEKIGAQIRRIVTDDMVYKIYVKDYKVEAVVSANNNHDRYIGSHPVTLFNLRGVGVDTDSGSTDLEHTTARAVDLKWFDLDSVNDVSGTKTLGSVPTAVNAT
ncbi:MAG: prepilin-type N-terminal cleavage/methylation domain-containing protein [Ruminococcus sp.]|nr:prepilin-type N-terminal cleavage/methylation domain-containing protein [Ruminococcus sp.]